MSQKKRSDKSLKYVSQAEERLESFPVFGSIEEAIRDWDNPKPKAPLSAASTTNENWKAIRAAAAGEVVDNLSSDGESTTSSGANTLTGPPQTPLPDFLVTREAGGVDWIEYSIYGEFAAGSWTLLRETLFDAKRLAAKADDGRMLMRTFDGKHILKVCAGGKGRGYSYCAFNCEIEGITIGICDRRESGGSPISGKHGQPIVFVKSTGLTCLVRGWRWVVERANGVLEAMGFKGYADAVSRLDLCTDVTGIRVRDFARCFFEGRSVRLSRKWAMWGDGEFDGLETLRFGSVDGLICRIYDKLAETRDDATKRALMRYVRWGIPDGEPDPPSATRIEFQLRREECKSQGLYQIEDLEKGIGVVMEYLTTKWLRFTALVPTQKDRTRAGIAAKWAKVQRESARWAIPNHGFNRCRRDTLPAEEKHLRAMNNGVLARLLAGRGHLPTTKDALIAAVTDIIGQDWRLIAGKTALRTMDLEDTIPGRGDKVKRAYCRDSVILDERLSPVAALAGEMA